MARRWQAPGAPTRALCGLFFSSRRRHTRYWRDWSSDVCSSDLGQREQLVLRSDENAHAVAPLGAPQQIDHAALGFEIVEQQPYPLQILERVQILQKIGDRKSVV